MSVDVVSVPVESNGEIVTAFAPVAGGGGVIAAEHEIAIAVHVEHRHRVREGFQCHRFRGVIVQTAFVADPDFKQITEDVNRFGVACRTFEKSYESVTQRRSVCRQMQVRQQQGAHVAAASTSVALLISTGVFGTS